MEELLLIDNQDKEAEDDEDSDGWFELEEDFNCHAFATFYVFDKEREEENILKYLENKVKNKPNDEFDAQKQEEL
jgi:hypothetical protein